MDQLLTFVIGTPQALLLGYALVAAILVGIFAVIAGLRALAHGLSTLRH